MVCFPIAYASKKLLPRENYSVIERECLAIVLGIRKFQNICTVQSLCYRQIMHNCLTYRNVR